MPRFGTPFFPSGVLNFRRVFLIATAAMLMHRLFLVLPIAAPFPPAVRLKHGGMAPGV